MHHQTKIEAQDDDDDDAQDDAQDDDLCEESGLQSQVDLTVIPIENTQMKPRARAASIWLDQQSSQIESYLDHTLCLKQRECDQD